MLGLFHLRSSGGRTGNHNNQSFKGAVVVTLCQNEADVIKCLMGSAKQKVWGSGIFFSVRPPLRISNGIPIIWSTNLTLSLKLMCKKNYTRFLWGPHTPPDNVLNMLKRKKCNFKSQTYNCASTKQPHISNLVLRIPHSYNAKIAKICNLACYSDNNPSF